MHAVSHCQCDGGNCTCAFNISSADVWYGTEPIKTTPAGSYTTACVHQDLYQECPMASLLILYELLCVGVQGAARVVEDSAG